MTARDDEHHRERAKHSQDRPHQPWSVPEGEDKDTDDEFAGDHNDSSDRGERGRHPKVGERYREPAQVAHFAHSAEQERCSDSGEQQHADGVHGGTLSDSVRPCPQPITQRPTRLRLRRKVRQARLTRATLSDTRRYSSCHRPAATPLFACR